VSPLFGSSYIPTHDGEYHIIRFVEFYRMLSQGYWFPKWAPTMNSGYGIPIFLFHYPLPNYVGAFFQFLGRNAVDAFKLSMGLGYVLSYISCFIWLRKLFGTKAAAFGTVLAGCVPYWFVDMYVRGSVGEIWAIALLFMALVSIEYKRLIFCSFIIGALVVSHNILAMLFVPFLVGYMFIRNKQFFPAIFFGLGLASFFWIPALFERQYVVGLNTVDFREHFVALYELLIPSWGTEFSGAAFGGNKISFQIGIIPLGILILSFFVFFRSKEKEMKQLCIYIACVMLCSIACMLPWSKFLWEYITPLQFIQYPWRLLSFLIPCIAFLGAYSAKKIGKTFLFACIGIAAFVFSFHYMSPVLYAPRDTWYYLSRPNFTDGTSSMGNSFSTIWTGWKSKRPQYLIEVLNGKVSGGITTNTFLTKTFTIASAQGADVYMSILYYPGWEVLVDKKSVPIDYKTDGTIRFSVASGSHHIVVHFGETLIRTVANFISLVSLVWLLGWGILGIYDRRYRHVATVIRS